MTKAKTVATAPSGATHRAQDPSKLPTPSEMDATIALQRVPSFGDMRIRIEGEGPWPAFDEPAYESISRVCTEDALASVLIGRRDGTWAATDWFGLGKFVLGGEYELPEPTGWEPPATNRDLMVPVEEVRAAVDAAWNGTIAEGSTECDREARIALEYRLVAEEAAHGWADVPPSYGDVLLIVDGNKLLGQDPWGLLVPLFASEAVLSCEIGLGDGRWTAYDCMTMLGLVDSMA